MNKYTDFTWELKQPMEHLGDSDTNCSWYTWNGLQKLRKKDWRIWKLEE